MSRMIRVTSNARSAYAVLETLLQEEVREHAARIADDPASWLRRSGLPGEPMGMWACDIESRVVPGLRVVLLIDGLALDPPNLVLVDVQQHMNDPGS
jgi:hypothetical protein